MARHCSDKFGGYRYVYLDEDNKMRTVTKTTRLPSGTSLVALPYSEDWNPKQLTHADMDVVAEALRSGTGPLPSGALMFADPGTGELRLVAQQPGGIEDPKYPKAPPDALLGHIRSHIVVSQARIKAAAADLGSKVERAASTWDAMLADGFTPRDVLSDPQLLAPIVLDELTADHAELGAVVQSGERLAGMLPVKDRGHLSPEQVREAELWAAICCGVPTTEVARVASIAERLPIDPSKLHPGPLHRRPDLTWQTDSVSVLINPGARYYDDERMVPIGVSGPTVVCVDAAHAAQLHAQTQVVATLVAGGHPVTEKLPESLRGHLGYEDDPLPEDILFDDEFVERSDWRTRLRGYNPAVLVRRDIPLTGVSGDEPVVFENGCVYMVVSDDGWPVRCFEDLDIRGAYPSGAAARRALAELADEQVTGPPASWLDRRHFDQFDVAYDLDSDGEVVDDEDGYEPTDEVVNAWEWMRRAPGRVMASGYSARDPELVASYEEFDAEKTNDKKLSFRDQLAIIAVPVAAPPG